MSTTPVLLTDREALTRARRRIKPEALFLHKQAAERLHETLEVVKRTFRNPAIVTGHPDFWSREFPDARLVADAEVLDLREAAHDLVIHAMALHWANDPVGQMIQCRRALRPDGLFLAIFPGGGSLQELREALATAETQMRGGLAPRVLPMMELRSAGSLLQRAGLALPVADTDRYDVSYADITALMQELRTMGEANAQSARDRRFLPRGVLTEAARLYHDHHATEDGTRIRATFELVHLLGWAPDDSQPVPLRPGSATARLADALGTAETRLRDDSPGQSD
ncbi:methyltransferase domain-containing protein [Palleronia caenipelagi]|uniref:Methyltransferase domain-containing protein n=1 Tax=Palleronia caenipelagi TaxID=2489174 RepID=A0A547Q6I3_9RHOB|nr:methyltransferase domain-containing protein [Palleronia caenipelagi]TRD21974.1 methyltransferase domain-containing protein [Palleronia caenipelagi]